MTSSLAPADEWAAIKSRLAALNQAYAVAEFDLNGFFMAANTRYLQLMKCSHLSEIVGLNHSMSFECGQIRAEPYVEFWQKLRCGGVASGVYRQVDGEGNIIWLQASYGPILDARGAVVGIIQLASDVTDQTKKNMEAEWQLRAIDKSQAVIEFDVEGKILTANANYCNAMGYVLQDIRGQHHRIFCESSYVDSDDYREFWNKLKRGEYISGEFKRVARDGHTVFIEASYNPLVDADGKVDRIVKFATDVTERRSVEAQNAELETRARAASQASELKSAFLATVSHELRTPLGGILGLTYILNSEVDLGASAKYLDQIHDCAEGLLSIVNNLLDLSKIEAGKMHLEHLPFDLRREVESVCDTNRPAIAKRGLSLSISIAEEIPPILRGDALRLRQILNNLIGNAIKFSNAGTLNIVVEPVMPGEETPNAVCLLFRVRDQGRGIHPDDLGKLFVPFSQVDSTISRRFGGTGLGLSICRALVDSMGGAIDVVSDEGKGSEFRFSVPFEIGAVKPVKKRTDQNLPSLFGHVLLVDDNAVNRTFISFMIGRMGLSVDICDNGRSAVDRVQSSSYQGVIMDCQMPEMDGFDATRKIREWELMHRAARLPIIALTANAMAGERDKCLRAGMDDFLSKPVTFEGLYRSLSKFFLPPDRQVADMQR